VFTIPNLEARKMTQILNQAIRRTVGRLLTLLLISPLVWADETGPTIEVRSTRDFAVTGDGSNTAWNVADWVSLDRRPEGTHEYTARFKSVYSDTGIYFLFDGTDATLTTTMQNDFENLWEEDVYEVFLWTDERHPIYFEYEISPLNKELPIIIPNFDGTYLGWRPWKYTGDRKTRKAVSIRGGEQKSQATVKGWSAEVFVPYDLLAPLQNVPPKRGTTWRANVYRVDYDDGHVTSWDWSRVGATFHEFHKFGILKFQ